MFICGHVQHGEKYGEQTLECEHDLLQQAGVGKRDVEVCVGRRAGEKESMTRRVYTFCSM